MMTPLESLIATGTKVWLDSMDPGAVARNRGWGVTGATSNPTIVKELIQTGRFDAALTRFLHEDAGDQQVAWQLTDQLVREAEAVFLPVWQATHGDDGYVSVELDPLLEDANLVWSAEERTRRYLELGKEWSAGHPNRMIKVPNTPSGRAALEELAAAGVSLNVTLTFTERQYVAARDAVWRGAQRRQSLDWFKSVYSIFVSRLDVYTEKHVPRLSPAAQGQVGIVNAKRLWQLNQRFWADKGLPLKQEIVFASTGVKRQGDPPWKYVEALAGSDIQTNPPETNERVQASRRTFSRQVDRMPPAAVLTEIDDNVDMQDLEAALVAEGLKKFADAEKELLTLISEKRRSQFGVGRPGHSGE